MDIRISQAEIGDIDTLMKWRMEVLREVFSIPEDADVSELEKENREYYLSAIPSGEHVACFAHADGEIVGCGGMCLYREMPSPDNPTGQCAYLMNIYSRPQVRGHGVGRTIVEWLTGVAKERGITKIYLETSDAGRNLYREIGFEAMEGMMKSTS